MTNRYRYILFIIRLDRISKSDGTHVNITKFEIPYYNLILFTIPFLNKWNSRQIYFSIIILNQEITHPLLQYYSINKA